MIFRKEKNLDAFAETFTLMIDWFRRFPVRSSSGTSWSRPLPFFDWDSKLIKKINLKSVSLPQDRIVATSLMAR